MRGVLLRAVTGIAIAAGGLACSNSLAPLPLDVRVQSSRATAVVGDTIAFVVEAQGGALVGVTLDYGDAGQDLYRTEGARTARVSFTHVYAAPGSYAVQAIATDATLGTKSAGLQITIN